MTGKRSIKWQIGKPTMGKREEAVEKENSRETIRRVALLKIGTKASTMHRGFLLLNFIIHTKQWDATSMSCTHYNAGNSWSSIISCNTLLSWGCLFEWLQRGGKDSWKRREMRLWDGRGGFGGENESTWSQFRVGSAKNAWNEWKVRIHMTQTVS